MGHNGRTGLGDRHPIIRGFILCLAGVALAGCGTKYPHYEPSTTEAQGDGAVAVAYIKCDGEPGVSSTGAVDGTDTTFHLFCDGKPTHDISGGTYPGGSEPIARTTDDGWVEAFRRKVKCGKTIVDCTFTTDINPGDSTMRLNVVPGTGHPKSEEPLLHPVGQVAHNWGTATNE